MRTRGNERWPEEQHDSGPCLQHIVPRITVDGAGGVKCGEERVCHYLTLCFRSSRDDLEETFDLINPARETGAGAGAGAGKIQRRVPHKQNNTFKQATHSALHTTKTDIITPNTSRVFERNLRETVKKKRGYRIPNTPESSTHSAPHAGSKLNSQLQPHH